MAFNLQSKIDSAVEKYGGQDEQYKQELRNEVRNYLGYQNFVDKMNEEAGETPDINFRGNLRPQAIQAQLKRGYDRQFGEVEHYGQLADRATQAGTQIATSLASKRGGSGSGSYQFQDDFINKEPENWLERELQRYYTNPFEESGQMKDVEEIKKELMIKRDQIKTMAGEAPGEGVEAYGESPETKLFTDDEIGQKVDELIGDPDQFQKAHYKSLGFTDTIAENMMLSDKMASGEMSLNVMEIVKNAKPKVYDDAMMMQANEGLRDKRRLKQDKDGNLSMVGGTVDYKKLRQEYPDAPEERLKSMMKPTYEALAMNDAQMEIRNLMPEIEGDNLVELMDETTIKNLEAKFGMHYAGILTPEEIKNIIREAYQSQQFIGKSNIQGGGSGGSF